MPKEYGTVDLNMWQFWVIAHSLWGKALCYLQGFDCFIVYYVVLKEVRDDPKLPGDSKEVPISKRAVGGSIPAVKSSLYSMRKKN
jgi:hypothetical protein